MAKERTRITLFHPMLSTLAGQLRMVRANMHSLEKTEKDTKVLINAYLDDVDPVDDYIVGDFKVSRSWNEGRKSIDRVALLEQGVSPEVIDKATKQGSGYYTVRVDPVEEEVESIRSN